MHPQIIPRLDLMIAYSCNIACRGCISLSDFKRDGIADFDDIKQWIEYWSKLLEPKIVTLFGGEPCLHPRLVEICKLVRQYWPTCTIRLITNGYLLDRFEPSGWFDFGCFEIQVSVHRKDHEKHINQRIRQILQQRKDWKTSISDNPAHHGQIYWTSGNFTIYKSIFKDFIVPFQTVDNTIQPWNSDPVQAHAICGAPDTPVLYQGKLYKCPAVANAMDIARQNWFAYEPCTGSDNLENFIAGIGRPEVVCGQCPARDQAVVVNHMDINNVIVRQKNIG